VASNPEGRALQRAFDEDLEDLKRRLIRESALAETMIADAIKALMERDATVLPVIEERERQVDAMQRDIDEFCLTLIALNQPAAGDLRFILGAAKANTDLERLADQAVSISHKAARLLQGPAARPFPEIADMASIAREMVRDSLRAFVNRQADRARSVIERDAALSELKSRVRRNLQRGMEDDPAAIPQAMDLLLASRNLERIGDHAKNIAAHTIFVVEGQDVRHTSTPA